jgi:hypothetical protein
MMSIRAASYRLAHVARMNAMHHRNPLAYLALVAVLGLTLAPARGQDASRLPDWKGQWIRIGSGSFDPTKPAGLRQDAPLIPEYQTILQASVTAQAAGGQGNDPMARCIPPGMPRMMINYGLGMEFILTPETTYLMFGEPMRQLRRIYTDGRTWPAAIAPSFAGYSIGRWEGDDGHGHDSRLVVETRSMRGPRSYDSSGLPFHADGETIVAERMYLDPGKADILYDEMTVQDHALTRPWSVKRTYRRQRQPVWLETICGEVEPQVRIGPEDYFVTYDGLLMPTRKDQPPPDLRNFK